MNDPETVRTIAWTVLFIFAINGLSTYAVIRLLVTGRPLFERQETEEPRRRVVGIGDR